MHNVKGHTFRDSDRPKGAGGVHGSTVWKEIFLSRMVKHDFQVMMRRCRPAGRQRLRRQGGLQVEAPETGTLREGGNYLRAPLQAQWRSQVASTQAISVFSNPTLKKIQAIPSTIDRSSFTSVSASGSVYDVLTSTDGVKTCQEQSLGESCSRQWPQRRRLRCLSCIPLTARAAQMGAGKSSATLFRMALRGNSYRLGRRWRYVSDDADNDSGDDSNTKNVTETFKLRSQAHAHNPPRSY